MRIFAFVPLAFLFSVVTANQGFCENQADPDSGIGNYCYCNGDGKCYFDSPSTGCNPPDSIAIPCP
ncbi:hypothetical protein ACSS6W_005811 [Trichoderma asperelloides]